MIWIWTQACQYFNREITHVDELNGVFRVRFDYIKEWRDHNLKFKNLHENIVNSVRYGSLNTNTLHIIRMRSATFENIVYQN